MTFTDSRLRFWTSNSESQNANYGQSDDAKAVDLYLSPDKHISIDLSVTAKMWRSPYHCIDTLSSIFLMHCEKIKLQNKYCRTSYFCKRVPVPWQIALINSCRRFWPIRMVKFYSCQLLLTSKLVTAAGAYWLVNHCSAEYSLQNTVYMAASQVRPLDTHY